MKKNEQKIEPVVEEVEDVQIQNMGSLVDVLIGEINLLRKGKITPQRANAMSNVTGKIMQAVKLSVETQRYINKVDSSGSGIPLMGIATGSTKGITSKVA